LGGLIRAERTRFAISTKYTTATGARSILETGNSRKAMMQSIDASLTRLGTDYVDIFWVHFADQLTATEEIVRGLDDIVRQGKALYVGFSDFPAWRVSRAATIAEMRGWAPVSALQIEYSLAERSAERDLIPMAHAYGMAVMIFAALGGGVLTGKYRRGEQGRKEKGGGAIRALPPEREAAILAAIDTVAGELEASAAQVALAWVRARAEATGAAFIPILGARTLAQLEDNLGALAITLTAEQLATLDMASAIPLGFPHELLEQPWLRDLQSGGWWDQLDVPPRTAL
jgi:aryl-alcohol dehydrogenase-like predicted oxidoreductase